MASFKFMWRRECVMDTLPLDIYDIVIIIITTVHEVPTSQTLHYAVTFTQPLRITLLHIWQISKLGCKWWKHLSLESDGPRFKS